MFSEEGEWKEFGIGRDSERFTWLPFWLFTVLWAMICFFLIQTLAVFGIIRGIGSVAEKIQKTALREGGPTELKPGYYMLNAEGTTTEGVPKYIYIGSSPATGGN